MDLTGTRALVTGGGGGLGRHISLALAGAGADVAVTWLAREGGAARVCADVRALGRRAMALRLDVTDAAAIEAVVAEVAAAWGGLDILVNNAGRGRPVLPGESKPREVAYGDIAALTPELYDLMMAINTRGQFLLARAAAPFLRASGRGRIVTISSGAGIGVSLTGIQAYAAAKAGEIGLTRQLAHELGPFGITVNSIAPGFVRSNPTTERQWDSYGADGQAKLVQGIFLRRTGTVEDISNMTLFLASSRAGWITGQVIQVNGGRA